MFFHFIIFHIQILINSNLINYKLIIELYQTLVSKLLVFKVSNISKNNLL